MRERRSVRESRRIRASAQEHFNEGTHHLEEAIVSLHLAWDADTVHFERTGLLPALDMLESILVRIEGMARRGRPMGLRDAEDP